jgi:DNA polymerase III alpha subunit (gram-positive type)
MSYFMIDVETDGPSPGDYSMIQLGAVLVREPLSTPITFYGCLAPISANWQPAALKVTGLTRGQTETFDDAATVMREFDAWVMKHNVGKRPMFISDNNGYDYMFVTWYCYHFLGHSPFGHSSTNLGSLYKGMIKDTFKNFKFLRQTKHTHNPVDDAMGNAEALVHMKKEMGLGIVLE